MLIVCLRYVNRIAQTANTPLKTFSESQNEDVPVGLIQLGF